jgi:hypothetical protein
MNTCYLIRLAGTWYLAVTSLWSSHDTFEEIVELNDRDLDIAPFI